MSRKDYVLIASVIRNLWVGPEDRNHIFRAFARRLAEENPRFDVNKFKEAVYNG